jgi:hypothetical protein
MHIQEAYSQLAYPLLKPGVPVAARGIMGNATSDSALLDHASIA